MNATIQPQRLGRYALYERIASGGMATVYFGKLVGSGGFSRIVAVKRLHPHLAQEREFASMLMDEAYLAGRIRHPNVVSTLDIVSADGELFVVMDYIHGETLARLTRGSRTEQKPIPTPIAVAIMVGVLNGLHAAHETTNERGEPLHIVHRDVSPQNVVVGVDGIPRLLDFGVAKAQYRLQTTQDGQIKGKLGYMSVEQLLNQGVDRRADIYGAGVILWELLTGRRLFAGETESSTLHIILNGNHPPPSSVLPSVPASLDAITMRALSRNVAQRFETARQMSAALEQAIQASTSTTVGEWVASIAEPQLAERARIIRDIDSRQGSRNGDELTTEPPSSIDVEVERSSVRSHAARDEAPTLLLPRRSKTGVTALVLAAGIAVVSLAVAAMTAANKSTPEVASPASGASAEPSPLAPTVPSSPAAQVVTAPSSASAAPLASLPAPSTAAVSSIAKPGPPGFALPRSHGGARPGPAPAARPAAASCNPPYTVDSLGIRHYKPECS